MLHVSHLPDKSDGWLVKTFLLRIPNVGGYDSVEGETAGYSVLLESDAILLCLDCEFASDCILHVEDCRVKSVDGERIHGQG